MCCGIALMSFAQIGSAAAALRLVVGGVRVWSFNQTGDDGCFGA